MDPIKTSRSSVAVLLPYLAILATFYTLYLAKTIMLPIVIASFIALFSSPTVSKLEKLRVPRSLGSLAVLFTVIVAVSAVVLLFTGPAQIWWEKLPQLATDMSTSISEATKALDENKEAAAAGSSQSVKDAGESIRQSTFLAIFKSFASATPIFLAQILATIFLVYFFLVYGNVFLLKILQTLDSFKDKRHTVELVVKMQQELSRYVSTITIINLGLGLVVGAVFYFLGVEDAFLWGALAGTLNFAPYIGPMVSAIAFLLVAYLQFGDIEHALLIPGIYLGINLIESQFVTPTLLGNTLDLNPLVVFLWLLLWGWIWGGFGMLIGVPLLVCLSIYLEHSGLIGKWHTLIKNKSYPHTEEEKKELEEL